MLLYYRGFVIHSFLPYYYAIKGKRKDGYSCVLYLNGGHPTLGALDYMRKCSAVLCSVSPHHVLAFILRKLHLVWLSALPRVRRILHSSTAFFS
jgi:hypothetical protein